MSDPDLRADDRLIRSGVDGEVDIVRLTRQWNRADFDCGVPAMNDFIQRYALQNEENHLSRTCLATARATARPDISTGTEERRVDRSYQGRGMDGILLLDALARFELLDRINPIPAVVLDLREEVLRPFYARYGFVACGESAPNRMYLLMKTIEKLRLNE